MHRSQKLSGNRRGNFSSHCFALLFGGLEIIGAWLDNHSKLLIDVWKRNAQKAIGKSGKSAGQIDRIQWIAVQCWSGIRGQIEISGVGLTSKRHRPKPQSCGG